jgi:hypothetical protein
MSVADPRWPCHLNPPAVFQAFDELGEVYHSIEKRISEVQAKAAASNSEGELGPSAKIFVTGQTGNKALVHCYEEAQTVCAQGLKEVSLLASQPAHSWFLDRSCSASRRRTACLTLPSVTAVAAAVNEESK